MMGGKQTKTNMFQGMQNGPTCMKIVPQLEIFVSSIAPSTNSFTQNHPYIEVKSSSLKLPTDEKGKKPMKESSSSKTSKPAYVHSKASAKELQGEDRREISHLDMFLEISQY
jgi:hypothetical protein